MSVYDRQYNVSTSSVDIFHGLDDEIDPNADLEDNNERIVLYPNGQKGAKSCLIDYKSLNNKIYNSQVKKDKVSFSKALSQGRIINNKIKLSKKHVLNNLQNQIQSGKFSIDNNNKYLIDSKVIPEYQPISSALISESKAAIIYDEPSVNFADIAPFVESYTEALLNSYVHISENESKLHVEKLNEIVKESEASLGKVIEKQKKYLAAVRVRVDKMIDKFAGKRQLVYDLREVKREYGNCKYKNDSLEKQVMEAQEKLLESSNVGAASLKLKIGSRKKRVDKNVKRLKGEFETLQQRLPSLETELEVLQSKKEEIIETLKRRDREIEDMEMEIDVEEKIAKTKVAVPEKIRVEMNENVLTLNGYSMFFKELATGLGFSLECKICDKRLDNPRQVWTCGHVFCQKCLKKAASNGNKGRLDSFASLIKAVEKKKAELHEILTDYNDNGKISRLEFEIALRRVKIMLNEEQKNVLWELIDPLGIDSTSMGTVVAVLSGQFGKVGGLKAIISPSRRSSRTPTFATKHRMSMLAAKAKFRVASSSKRKLGMSLCPFCEIEADKKQFVKEDPLTEKILQRLGFFERDQTKDGDILALCENYKNSLDEIEAILR